jgi:hypothetical protein
MGSRLFKFIVLLLIMIISCNQEENISNMNIIFLHHSTGGVIWEGGSSSLASNMARKVSNRLADFLSPKAKLPALFDEFNEKQNKNYRIKEMIFPKPAPYGWNNYPFDYYNIWVKNSGQRPFLGEPTLELLTKEFQVIIFKHCFPSSNILADLDSADINSDIKTISNYKLQYLILRDKLHDFPDTKFILFTGPAQVKSLTTEDQARRSREFYEWVTRDWDLPFDNIYLWDLYKLQTGGDLYFRDDYAVSPYDSHPNEEFASKAVKLLFNRIIDIVENKGSGTQLTGELKLNM